MKKILLIFIMFLFTNPAFAAAIKVESLSDFTTEKPLTTLTVKAVTDLDINDEVLILAGYTLKGNIVDVSSPKRLKRDASFSFVLTEYTDNNGKKHVLKNPVKGKYTTNFDYKGVAKSAALSVGNHFVKGISAGYTVVEGAVKNEEDNRLKSGAVAFYESTPLSYIEKGEDIVIKKDEIFILNFKVKNEEDKPNYEYTQDEKKIDKSEQKDSTVPVTEKKALPEADSNEHDKTAKPKAENKTDINEVKPVEKEIKHEINAEQSSNEVKKDEPAVQTKIETVKEKLNSSEKSEIRQIKKYTPYEPDDSVIEKIAPDAPLAPLELPDTY